jgi:hypothetical protein
MLNTQSDKKTFAWMIWKYTDLINHISKEKCGDTQNIIGPNVHVNSEEESNTLVVCYILKNIAPSISLMLKMWSIKSYIMVT